MKKKENNYAFIDSQNLNLGIQKLYDNLQESGFILEFKPTTPDKDGNIKGNVDADLVLRVVLKINEYNKAIIVSSDGDFYSLVQHLYSVGKLETILSPDVINCSVLLQKSAKEKIRFMDNLQKKLEYKRKAPPRDGTHEGASQ